MTDNEELVYLRRENALLRYRNGDSDYNGEIHRALFAIPTEFIGNDAWENAVERLAASWNQLKLDLLHYKNREKGLMEECNRRDRERDAD